MRSNLNVVRPFPSALPDADLHSGVRTERQAPHPTQVAATIYHRLNECRPVL